MDIEETADRMERGPWDPAQAKRDWERVWQSYESEETADGITIGEIAERSCVKVRRVEAFFDCLSLAVMGLPWYGGGWDDGDKERITLALEVRRVLRADEEAA